MSEYRVDQALAVLSDAMDKMCAPTPREQMVRRAAPALLKLAKALTPMSQVFGHVGHYHSPLGACLKCDIQDAQTELANAVLGAEK